MGHIDDALIGAAEALLAESGFRGVTVNAVVERAGSNRPSFYRRYRGIPDLILTVLQTRYGRTLQIADLGHLGKELFEIQLDQLRMFAEPLMMRGLAGFLEAARNDPELERAFVEGFLQPRRTAIKDVIGRAVLRGDIPIPEDPEWICDLLTGPLAMRAVFPGEAPVDLDLAQRTTRAALRELGWTGDSNLEMVF